ncbi:ATP-binding cassette domain-containing protein [Corynebacterium sp. Marseille-Q2516]
MIIHKVLRGFSLGPIEMPLIGDGRLVVLGDNGAGKTTLLRALVDELEAGKRSAVAYLPQEQRLPALSRVRDLLAYAAVEAGVPRAEVSARVEAAAQAVGFAEMLGRRGRALSGGQRQLVAIAATLVGVGEAEGAADGAVPTIVLDEPTNNLDVEHVAHVTRLITDPPGQLAAARWVICTHDHDLAEAVASHVLVLRGGQLAFAGTRQEFLDTAPAGTAQWAEAYRQALTSGPGPGAGNGSGEAPTTETSEGERS